MCSDTSDDIKRQFELRALRRQAQILRQPGDWDKANEITSRYKNETRLTSQKYYGQYDDRVAKRLKTLIDKAGAKTKDHTLKLFGTDQFNQQRLKRQAHREVQHDHARRLNSIVDREKTELGSFLDVVHERNEKRDERRQEFKRSADPLQTDQKENQPRGQSQRLSRDH